MPVPTKSSVTSSPAQSSGSDPAKSGESNQALPLSDLFRHLKRTVSGLPRYRHLLQTLTRLEKAIRPHRRILRQPAAHSDWLPLHEKTAPIVADFFSQSGGAWIKFAQFLSCRPDILPSPYIQAFARLQDAAPSARFTDVQHLLSVRLGDDWPAQFRNFNIIPVASGSIAQVHRARLNDGREVAVKLQLPHIRQQFEQDSSLLTVIANLLNPFVQQVDLRQIVSQLLDTTFQELDFRLEAENIARFHQHARLPGIRIPHVVNELSGEHVLVTEWIDGPSLAQYLNHPDNDHAVILTRLMQSTLRQVLLHGLFHSDPHPGNFIVTPDKALAILDFGAVQQLTERERVSYANLLMQLMGLSQGSLAQAFEQAGFAGIDEHGLERLAGVLQGAHAGDVALHQGLNQLLEEFRKLKLVIPDPFVAIVRVLITLGGLMSQYGIPFSLDAFQA